MEYKRVYLVIVLGFMALVGLVSLLIFGVNILKIQQEKARSEYLPPIVSAIESQSIENIPADNYITLVSTINYPEQSPVKSVEWWLDGILLQKHSDLQFSENVLQFNDSYDLLMPSEGTHMLLVRAINTHDTIGQSQPLTFQIQADNENNNLETLNKSEMLENPAVTLVSDSPMLKVANAPSNTFSLLAMKPPQAPTNLQGEVKDCQVKLLWQDNSSNENGYEIWMAAPNSPLTRLATLQQASGGVTWFEFQSPGPGYFLFWVEAFNAIGQRGSNIIYLKAEADCPVGAATHLQVEIVDIAVSTGVERMYCYTSFEDAPEVRLPAQDGDFILVEGSKGNLNGWPRSYNIPIPQDGELNINGECLGWVSEDLIHMGKFSIILGSETWNGDPFQADGGTFILNLSAVALGGIKTILIATANPVNSNINVHNHSGRPIEAVYISQSGQTDWGNNLLGSNPILIGNTGSFTIGPGTYDLRAYCCGNLPLARKLNVTINGSYEWDVLAALDVYNDTDEKESKWQFPIDAFYFTTSQPGKYINYGANQLVSEKILPGEGRRWYLPEGIYSLKANLSGWVYECDHIYLNGVTDYYVSSNTYIITDGNTGERKSMQCNP